MKRTGKQAGVTAADYDVARKRQAERHDAKARRWLAAVEAATADLAAPAATLGDLVESGQDMVETDPPHLSLTEGFRRLALHPNTPEPAWHHLIYYGQKEVLAENAIVPLVLVMNGGQLEWLAMQMLVIRLVDEQKAFLKTSRAIVNVLVAKAEQAVQGRAAAEVGRLAWALDDVKKALKRGVKTAAIGNLSSVYDMAVADTSGPKEDVIAGYPSLRAFALETAHLGMPQSRWFSIKTG